MRAPLPAASSPGSSENSLDGRVVVVTGAASGIGWQTCRLLEDRGAEVVGVDRASTGAAARWVCADLSEPGGIDRAVRRLPAQVDGLCAIAGVPGTAGLAQVRAVNYLGLRHLVSGLVDRMPAGATIASAASVAGSHWRERTALHLALADAASYDEGLAWCESHPVEEELAYPYFKEALVVWTMRTAALLAPRGIRVNCVSPGPVDTPILDDFRTSLGADRVQRDIDRVGRAGRGSEVAPVFAFLMSAGSTWVRGVDLACDGGLAAMDAIDALAVTGPAR